jgi:hypothetical protein
MHADLSTVNLYEGIASVAHQSHNVSMTAGHQASYLILSLLFWMAWLSWVGFQPTVH